MMKVGFVFIVYLTIGRNVAGGQTLPELLKNAQSQTAEHHSAVSAALLQFRIDMSNYLTETVNECLSHILTALESLQPNTVTSDEQSSESEKIGDRISRCSAQADFDIQSAGKQFFQVFAPIQIGSLALLNTVIERIVEWDNTSDPTDIATRVHDVLEVSSNEFLSNVAPSLEVELRKFENILSLIPSSVSRCVGEALTN